MRSEPTFLGSVRRVVGAKVHVELAAELSSLSPIVGGRVYRLGQIGSFVRIPLGALDLYGIVSMVGAAESGNDGPGEPTPRGQRLLEVQLVGEAYAGEGFQRGVSIYPTLDDEVHAVTPDDLATIYAPGRGTLVLGTLAASESLPVGLDLGRHAAIVGSTGSGKSNTVAALLRAVVSGHLPSAKVVVVDPHGEYGSAFGSEAVVFRIADPSNPLFLPYWALSFDELAQFLVDRRGAGESPQDTLLRDRIAEMRQESLPRCKAHGGGNAVSAHEITADSPVPFDLRELWYYFDRKERTTFGEMARTTEKLVQEGSAHELRPARFEPPGAGSAPPFKAAPPPIMGSYVQRILGRLRDRRFDFLLQPGPYDGTQKDLDELVASWIDHNRPVTVLDLAGVPAEVTDLVVGLLSKMLFEIAFWGRREPGLGRQRPLLLVLEEAHTYLPSGESRFTQGHARRALQRIPREGRKYGIGTVIVTQRPSEIDETILSQCGTFIALRLTNPTDQGRVRSTLPDDLSVIVNLLPALRTGEAVITGDAVQIPTRIRVPLVEPRPDSQDPLVTERWSLSGALRPDLRKVVVAWRRQWVVD